MTTSPQDFLKDMDVRELLDLSPKVRRYLLAAIPDL
jgi:hypothetical protein